MFLPDLLTATANVLLLCKKGKVTAVPAGKLIYIRYENEKSLAQKWCR
jgi:hypothetical protein